VPHDLEGNLLKAVYNKDIEKINALIDDFFVCNSGLPNIFIHNLISMLFNIYINVTNQLEYSINIEEIYQNIEDEYDAERVKAYFSGLFFDLTIYNYIRNDTEKKVYDFIIEYINLNYADSGISIKLLADELHLSVAYVSKIFKKANIVPFSQYVSDFRIAKAKELLENTTMKVKDIAFAVGFGTHNNFSRAFSKKTGIPPNEYRNS
jgi:two-component system response regulator YesN